MRGHFAYKSGMRFYTVLIRQTALWTGGIPRFRNSRMPLGLRTFDHREPSVETLGHQPALLTEQWHPGRAWSFLTESNGEHSARRGGVP